MKPAMSPVARQTATPSAISGAEPLTITEATQLTIVITAPTDRASPPVSDEVLDGAEPGGRVGAYGSTTSCTRSPANRATP